MPAVLELRQVNLALLLLFSGVNLALLLLFSGELIPLAVSSFARGTASTLPATLVISLFA